ncbi:MAG TPA: NTP transferase domain-containing protein [Acidimicrobiales bacterium]|nr:NTP transferase domain-containing protein [Acidimicrobiales bacterium]
MSSDSPAPPIGPPAREQRDIAGIVLAGGESRRMGTDKATLRMPGTSETLLGRAARHLGEAGATEVVVATGTVGRLGPLRWTEVDDGDFAGDGPLAGLAAALAWLAADRSDVEVALVLAVDLPDASPIVLRWLAHELDVTGVPGLIPLDAAEGRPQPLHAAYRPSAVAGVLAGELQRGNRRVLRALAAAGAVHVDVPPDVVPADATPWHRNVNAPLDLHASRPASNDDHRGR